MQAFERARKDVDYYALDLSRPELERTLAEVEGKYKHVHCHGLVGTYDNGLAWLKRPENLQKPKCILWMGSSIGNLNRTEAADFLKGFLGILGDNDSMLIGIDACQDKDKVYRAYNDKESKTLEFYYNGLINANKLLGKEIFSKADWTVIGEYDGDAGRHQAFYSPVRDVVVEGLSIKAGEKVKFEESYKYSLLQSSELWQRAGLVPQAIFGNKFNDYRKCALCSLYMSRKSVQHPTNSSPSSSKELLPRASRSLGSAFPNHKLHHSWFASLQCLTSCYYYKSRTSISIAYSP